MNEELSESVEMNRDAILKELQGVYNARGKKNYAARLGELFALLDNIVVKLFFYWKRYSLIKFAGKCHIDSIRYRGLQAT